MANFHALSNIDNTHNTHQHHNMIQYQWGVISQSINIYNEHEQQIGIEFVRKCDSVP